MWQLAVAVHRSECTELVVLQAESKSVAMVHAEVMLLRTDFHLKRV
jgi:hypothetical protein